MLTNRLSKRKKRHLRIRSKIQGTKDLPRLNVFRSNAGFNAQIIDDEKQHTLVSANLKELKDCKTNNKEACKMLGELIASKAKAKKITNVVFDRGGFAYHGKIKSFAEGCREKGLKF